MIIGVDARSLSNKTNGIGRYTFELLIRLTNVKKYKWIIFAEKHSAIEGIPSRANIRIEILESKNKIHKQFNYHLLIPIRLKKLKCDIFWSPAHTFPLFISSKIKKILTIHDLVWKNFPKTMAIFSRYIESFLMPISIKKADKIISDSLAIRGEIIENFPKFKRKISVIYLAPKSFIPKIQRTTKTILFVGTFEPRKNLPRLINAFCGLSNEIKDDFELKLVGNKGWGPRITIPSNNNINMVGWVSDADLEKLYQEAYLLAMPSLYEGFGLPLVEAMARGVPVLTSNTSAMAEIVGDAGILIDPNSEESITNGLTKILSSAKLRQRYSKAAINRSKYFSWDKAFKETLELFDKYEND